MRIKERLSDPAQIKPRTIKTPLGIWYLRPWQFEQIRKYGARKFRVMFLGKGEKEKAKCLKKCPICGASRKNGYFKCCKNCYWIFEWREKLTPLFEQIKEIFKKKNANFRWDFLGTVVHLSVDVWAKCLTKNVLDEKEKPETIRFGANANLSLYELDRLNSNIEIKDLIVSLTKRLFEDADNAYKQAVDEKGKCVKLGETIFPVVGSWRDPIAR